MDCAVPGGKTLRFYYSTDISFFAEPVTEIFDEFSKSLRSGKTSSEKGIKLLKEKYGIIQESVPPRIIIEKLVEAMNAGKIPEIKKLREMKSLSDGLRTEIAEAFQEPYMRELKDSGRIWGDRLQ